MLSYDKQWILHDYTSQHDIKIEKYFKLINPRIVLLNNTTHGTNIVILDGNYLHIYRQDISGSLDISKIGPIDEIIIMDDQEIIHCIGKNNNSINLYSIKFYDSVSNKICINIKSCITIPKITNYKILYNDCLLFMSCDGIPIGFNLSFDFFNGTLLYKFVVLEHGKYDDILYVNGNDIIYKHDIVRTGSELYVKNIIYLYVKEWNGTLRRKDIICLVDDNNIFCYNNKCFGGYTNNWCPIFGIGCDATYVPTNFLKQLCVNVKPKCKIQYVSSVNNTCNKYYAKMVHVNYKQMVFQNILNITSGSYTIENKYNINIIKNICYYKNWTPLVYKFMNATDQNIIQMFLLCNKYCGIYKMPKYLLHNVVGKLFE